MITNWGHKFFELLCLNGIFSLQSIKVLGLTSGGQNLYQSPFMLQFFQLKRSAHSPFFYYSDGLAKWLADWGLAIRKHKRNLQILAYCSTILLEINALLLSELWKFLFTCLTKSISEYNCVSLLKIIKVLRKISIIQNVQLSLSNYYSTEKEVF